MNIQDKEGVTAMHWAARQGHTDIVTLLINNGAYPNYPDHSEYRQTPMDMCIDGQHNDTVG
jgi:ankyrin repeat protein